MKSTKSNTQDIVLYICIGMVAISLFILSCSKDRIVPDNSIGFPSDISKRSPNQFYLELEGLLRDPASASSDYVAYPRILPSTEAYSQSIKKYSFSLEAINGQPYSDDMTTKLNYDKIVENLLITELQIVNNIAEYEYQDSIRQLTLDQEMVAGLDSIPIQESPFIETRGPHGLVSFEQNIANMRSLGHVVNDLGSEIEVVGELDGIFTKTGESLILKMYFDKATELPVRSRIFNGSAELMKFEYANEYGDARDISIIKLINALETTRGKFTEF